MSALIVGLAGCDPLDIVFEDRIETRDLRGLWTGIEEITDAADIPTGVNDGRGVVLPVALDLGRQGFTLRSTIPPHAYDPASRVCHGVYSTRGRTLTFFPDTECRALPLREFRLSRQAGGRMELRARSSQANVQVWMRLDREGP